MLKFQSSAQPNFRVALTKRGRSRKMAGHECFKVLALEPYGTGFNYRLDCLGSCSASFDSARTWFTQDLRRKMGKADHNYALRHLPRRSGAADPHFKTLTVEAS